MLNLLEISLASGVPASLRNIPDKYNIIIRLWTNCFYRLLENLRRSSLSSKITLEYLQEFIYYAYTFYTALLERNTFEAYRAGWLEALGDLTRYCFVIAAHDSCSLSNCPRLQSLAPCFVRCWCQHFLGLLIRSICCLFDSSSFTLSSGTTDGSSAPSSIFDNKPRDVSKTRAVAYHGITVNAAHSCARPSSTR
jgi:hypothetical protein